MRALPSLRPAMSGFGALAGLTGGFVFVTLTEAEAQAAPPAVRLGDDAMQLPEVDVSGTQAPQTNTLQDTSGISRLPDRLQSTPQTVTVVPQIVIEQQQATSINQVLQYVPGITVSTGEGNGGISGDQFRIRGFDASGDIYVDGLRDFGSYVRDSFATESVAVLKGPSSGSFGNGTTGGVIELDSKKAHLGNASSFEITGGMGPYGRGVLDVNRQIDETTAFRIVVMGQGQDVVARDYVYANRGGVLASAGFGLGTDQQVTVNYFHQRSDQRPDFGVPIVNTDGVVGKPVTEYGVPRSTYFGRQSDADASNADVGTVLYKGQFGDWLTLTNDSRMGYYSHNLKFSPVFCLSPGLPGRHSSCATDVLKGNLNTGYTIWEVGGTETNSFGGENVTAAVMRFNTGLFRHEVVTGLDVYAQRARTGFYLPSGPEPAGTLLQPIFVNSPGFDDVLAASNISASSYDIGPFVSERFWATPTLSVLGGVRWDHYNAGGASEGTRFNTTTEFASPKASVIWEPTKQQIYYASYAQSFTPPGNNITSLSSSLGVSQNGVTANLKPEKDDTFEVGSKWSALEQRLGLTAAVFRVNKSDANYIDPTSGIQSTTDDKDRVQGIELGATGKITPLWDIQASYSYLDSKINQSGVDMFTPTSARGNKVPYVSAQNVAVWTTYDVTSFIKGLPGRMLVGGGMNFRTGYYVDDANALRVPGAVTTDLLLSYDPVDRYHLALNVTNVTNGLAYGSAFTNGYATPVAGRTVSATLAVRF